jgi:FKBP-type peptidyl-prolyl cis-trans isomerase FklB
MNLQEKLQQHREAKLKEEKEKGAAFLAANKTKEGIIELPNGMQYQVLQEGSGNKPTIQSSVKAHYIGRLLNGNEFDNSYKRNRPFTASLKSLIKGWQDALPLMAEGSKWRLWIPSHLAYGDMGAGQAGIPGGALLEFEIELLQVIN